MKKQLALTIACLMAAAVAFGQETYTTNLTVNTVIPDNNPNGFAQAVTIGVLDGPIASVTVSLDITGGFNGDLYAYLVGPTGGFAILLNRTGVGISSPSGYGDAGFNITLSDSAASGIHYYQNVLNPGGSALTGTWQPDGLNIDPQSTGSVFNSAVPTAMLSSFTGLNGNGQWVFFIADMSPGGQSTLNSFGLTVMTVPEPSTLALVSLAGLGLIIWRRRVSAKA